MSHYRVPNDPRSAFDSLWRCCLDQQARRARAHMFDHKADRVQSCESLPRTVEQLRALRDQIASTPQGGALVFIIALINYCSPDNRAEGVKMCVLATSEENVVKSDAAGNLNGYVLHRSDVERLNRANAQTANSYVIGTGPETDYGLPAGKLEIGFRDQNKNAGSDASGKRKVFVWSTGADTARPIALTRNVKGIWKVNEFSSIVTGVRPGAGAGAGAAADAL